MWVCGGDGIPAGACSCSGEVLDACGVCGGDGSSCVGCTYELACNYDPDATILDASLCEFGTCLGCTVVGACNYNPTVAGDDGSCEWCSCSATQSSPQAVSALTEIEGNSNGTGYWLELETVTAHIGGALDGQTTYRLYLNTLNENDYLSACSETRTALWKSLLPQGHGTTIRRTPLGTLWASIRPS